jgi:hypothetical protein
VPKPHRQLAVRGGQVPTEREILKLAEQVSYVFGLPEAAGLKEQLQWDAEVYRDWLHTQQHMEDEAHNRSLGLDEKGRKRVAYGIGSQRFLPGPETLTFLLALLFACPQMLLRPVGFEWVLQDLEKVLVARRLDPVTDQGFEKAMNKARTRSRVGPPKDKALEYFRYATINELKNLSVVIRGVPAKMGKTKAVEFVAEIEHRHFGGNAGVSSIWKSYKRADRFFRQLCQRVQKTKKPVTQSKHRKRTKRT